MPRFSRNARLLIAISGVFAVSFYGVITLLRVLYILRLGHGPEYVGVFGAAGAFTYMAMSLPSGALGGRFGSRQIMRLGGIIAVLGMIILPLAEFVPAWARGLWPIASQVVTIAGWSMLNVNLVPALMAATTAQNRNSVYAVNAALRGLGTFLGTIFGGMLPGLFAGALCQTLDAPGPYRCALWVGAALGLAGLIPLSQVGQVKQIKPREQSRARGRFPLLPVALVVLHVYLSHAGWATCQAFFNAYMDAELHLSASSIGFITGAGQFVAILAPLLAPRLATRRSNRWTLMITTLGMGASLLPLALIPHWTAAGLGRLGVLVLSAIWMPALQVFQMELVHPEWRSLAYGAVSMAMGLSYGSASLAGGYIIAATGYRSLFLVGASLSAAGALMMWGILKRRRSSAAATAGSTDAVRDSNLLL